MKARILAPENRKWWTLAAVAFGLFMIMLDNTVVNVALPSIERDLHVSISELEWIVTAYALTFAALLITGGKLGDLYGRKLIFIVGIGIFTASSLACGLAPNAGFLIGARMVQGVGAALMNPASLSIITATFPPRERGQAIGIWAGVSAMALAIGPLVGGVIVETINWNWIFYINVPVGIAGIVVSWFVITESRDMSHEQSIDVPGLVTSGLGLFALTYALIEGNNHGWSSPEILSLFAAAAVLLVAFVVLEHRQRLPMLDLSLFKIGSFTGANIVAMLVSLGMFGVFFFVSLYVQNILGYSAIQAGAIFLPMTILIIIVAPLAGKRVRPDRVAVADGGGDDHRRDLAPALPAGRAPLGLLDAPSVAAARRRRHGADHVPDDRGRDGLGAGGQGRRRLRRAQQLPPDGRLARDRADGRHRRLVSHGVAALAGGRPAVRRRAPCGAARERRDHVRRRRCRDRARADVAADRAFASRGGDGVSTATRLPAAERRLALVEAAIRVFTDGSYRGTTTAEIARAAGVSEPILYRHFASKRDLYLAALDHVWSEARTRWEEAIAAAPDIGSALASMTRAHVSVRDCKYQLAELWVQALSEAAEDPELRRHLRRHMREVHDFTADVIRRGQEEGTLNQARDADAEAWTFLAGGVLGMVGRRIGLLDEQEVEAIRAARLEWLGAEPKPARSKRSRHGSRKEGGHLGGNLGSPRR